MTRRLASVPGVTLAGDLVDPGPCTCPPGGWKRHPSQDCPYWGEGQPHRRLSGERRPPDHDPTKEHSMTAHYYEVRPLNNPEAMPWGDADGPRFATLGAAQRWCDRELRRLKAQPGQGNSWLQRVIVRVEDGDDVSRHSARVEQSYEDWQ